MPIGPINFTGLSSGLDVNGIIDAIIQARRRPIDLAKNRQQALTKQKDAFAELRSAVSAVRTAVSSLNSAAVVAARTTTVSDSTLLSASATDLAAAGAHSIVVSTLAASSRMRSAGVADAASALVSDGTITLKAGTADTITIDVSAATGNNSLASIRDTINAAKKGVRASIVNDGTNAVLIVESEKTGTANALTVTDSTNLDLDTAGNVLQSAANAALTVDGISVSSQSNTVTTALDGVTLNLLKADASKTITMTVSRDSAALKKALNDFVEAYNKAADFFEKQVRSSGESSSPGPLSGDSTVRSVESALQGIAVSGVTGLSTSVLRSLGQVGLKLDSNNGRLSLDSTAFDKAFSERPDEMRALFLDAGTSTSAQVSFVSASKATKIGTYAVVVTTAAEQAVVTGATAVSGSGITASETLTISLGSASAQVSLSAGATIATIVSAANTALRNAGIEAVAEDSGGKLRVRTKAYGGSAAVSVVSSVANAGDGNSTGIGTTALTDSGLDAAGTIGGVAATASGQNLTAAAGTDAEGLSIIVRSAGSLGTITFSRGVASKAVADLTAITDAFGGPITSAQDALASAIDDVSDRISEMERRLTIQQDALLRQFTAMERALSTLQAQLSSLQNR